MTEEEFLPLFDKHRKFVFEDVHSYDPLSLLNEAEQRRIKSSTPAAIAPYKLHLGAFDGDNNFIGWSWGFQETVTNFYMVNSAVLPDHRRQGLYSALIGKCIEIVSKKGFQLIYSRHCATNNAVIIPKLKAGFIISKMELDDKYGVLVHLHFYTDPLRRKVMDYRAGQAKPDAEIKELFKL